VRLVPIPGVHRPRSDTWLLAGALRQENVRGRSVADLCTGSGALAIVAAREGAARVVAVDVSARAGLAVRVNARLNGCQVHARKGDLLNVLAEERFDLIMSNPPYVPSLTDALPRHRSTTPLDGGRDGRALLDRLCRDAPARLCPGGSLLLVHSSVCGTEETCRRLDAAGLDSEVVARARGPLGPVLAGRADLLRERGILPAGGEEELVVIRGRAA
jgi:release factor glutamine methyltransferase